MTLQWVVIQRVRAQAGDDVDLNAEVFIQYPMFSKVRYAIALYEHECIAPYWHRTCRKKIG